MKDHPILFSGEMVRAILEGRKSQTRRVIKPQPVPNADGSYDMETKPRSGYSNENSLRNFLDLYCPYGDPGDRLWVRETWAVHPSLNSRKPSEIPKNRVVYFRADPAVNETHYMWRPSIFMPRWMSRITLEIVKVRVERLQEISEEDAIAEGISDANLDDDTQLAKEHLLRGSLTIDRYARLWCQINGDTGYALNPWVWVIEFKKISLTPALLPLGEGNVDGGA